MPEKNASDAAKPLAEAEIPIIGNPANTVSSEFSMNWETSVAGTTGARRFLTFFDGTWNVYYQGKGLQARAQWMR
jgi:hypothetical protein